MTEPFDVAQWAKNWEAFSRQYQSALGGAPAPTPWLQQPPLTNMWGDGFAQAARQFGGAATQGAPAENMMAAAQGYLSMLQGMANAATQQAAPAANPFADVMKSMPGMGAFDASFASHPFASAMRNMGQQGTQGIEQLMQRFTGAAGPMFDQAQAALQFPAFGPMREKQERLQKSAAILIDYQEQMARFNRLMLKVSERAAARFQLKLAEREEPGRQIDSARGLYDIWVDAYEDAYAEIALSEEYREIYAALVDAQMRVRKHMQDEVERNCIELGMPTRSEVDTIGERLQTLRREYHNYREEVGDFAALKDELAALREEVASLKRAKPVVAVSNVVDFRKPVSAPPTKPAKAEAPAVAPVSRKPKQAAVPRKQVVAKAKSPPAKAATKSTTKKKSGQSFAASIARFARKTKSDGDVAGVRSAPSKSSKR